METIEQAQAAAEQMQAMGIAPCQDEYGSYYLLHVANIERHPLNGQLEVVDMPYREWDVPGGKVAMGIPGKAFKIPVGEF